MPHLASLQTRALPTCTSPLAWTHVIVLFLTLSTPTLSQDITSMCFEQLSKTAAIYMQEHPVRNRAAVATQKGMVYLTTLPTPGVNATMDVRSVFIDLTKRVHFAGEMGLHSFAFHPKFSSNGRFFVSYTCRRSVNKDCTAPLGCVPTADNRTGCLGVPVSPFSTVVAEYKTAGRRPLQSSTLNPREVRKIALFARPYTNHHGGHIFFGRDGFLYLTSGDGGNQGDPFSLAQNIRSLYGKILRFDVDKPTVIPPSNPFQAPGQNPLVYALGLRNPWRCDQDPVTRMIACGDVGGNLVEEVDVINPSGNYGWRNYEGRNYTGRGAKEGSPLFVGNFTYPVLDYTHSSLGGLGCIIGGVFYRSSINPCLQGRYLYADYSGPVWVSTLTGTPSTSKITFTCSPGSPITCPAASGDGSDSEWGAVYSWSKDLSGNAYLLTSTGIFRVSQLSRCSIACPATPRK